jgi:hypothetical protein
VRHSLRVLASCALGLLTTCAQSSSTRDTAATPEVDRAKCEAAGGAVQRVCLAGALACVVPFADAGRSCSDSSECEGLCLVEEGNWEPGALVVGACQEDSNPCWCASEVKQGKIEGGECWD